MDTSEKGCNSEELNRVFEEAADNETVKESLGALKGKCSTPSNISALQASLKLSYKSKGYFVNGRQISLDSVEFSSDDLATLVEYEYSNRINSYSTMVMDALSDQKLERLDLENRILCITSIMSVAKSMVGATGDPIKRQSLAVFSPFEGTKM